MDKVLLEFINTWPTCDAPGEVVMSLADKYPDKVDAKIYYVGKDTEYLQKYGMIFVGTLIINGDKRVTRLSRRNITKEVEAAIEELDS